MGFAGVPFFGDKRKAEIYAEIERLTAEISDLVAELKDIDEKVEVID